MPEASAAGAAAQPPILEIDVGDKKLTYLEEDQMQSIEFESFSWQHSAFSLFSLSLKKDPLAELFDEASRLKVIGDLDKSVKIYLQAVNNNSKLQLALFLSSCFSSV